MRSMFSTASFLLHIAVENFNSVNAGEALIVFQFFINYANPAGNAAQRLRWRGRDTLHLVCTIGLWTGCKLLTHNHIKLGQID